MNVPGSNIALLRRQMGLSQRQFSKAAGVDLSTLSRLESGKGGYSAESIERIAKVLSVSKGVLFAEPGVVEAAALGMREVPLLTAADLLAWPNSTPDGGRERDRFLHAPLRLVSPHSFALVAPDDSNAPLVERGDQLVFDAALQPKMGGFAVAQTDDGSLYLGSFRAVSGHDQAAPEFDIVPQLRVYPVASSRSMPSLKLRGMLAELRRSFALRVTN